MSTTTDGTGSRRVHASLTLDRVVEAIQRRDTTLDNPGFCVACGEEAEGCEPDARNYECASCGEREVYGAEEIVLSFHVFARK